MRGNEFTRQLDYFVDAILDKKMDNLAGFAGGHATDVLMDKIMIDAAVNCSNRERCHRAHTRRLAGSSHKPSFWEKIFKRMGTKHA